MFFYRVTICKLSKFYLYYQVEEEKITYGIIFLFFM